MDFAIIGGGFYGVAIAAHVATREDTRSVTLFERNDTLLAQASLRNQARVHNGYHYPRSLPTACRSRVNLPRFVTDWPDAIYKSFTKLYAIPKHGSKVTAKQFERFCHVIGAPAYPADVRLKSLFNSRLIEEVFVTEEYAFDATRLRAWAHEALRHFGVVLHCNSHVEEVTREGNQLRVNWRKTKTKEDRSIRCDRVFNCTYAGLNQIAGEVSGTRTKLKHELTEMALVSVPRELKDLGITVMDGPFFSLMPYPARELHTLSHVRYTPHQSFIDARSKSPYEVLEKYPRSTRWKRMLRDTIRYLPIIEEAHHVDSLFEVKTVLVKNEGDDGRPTLFEQDANLPGFYSILGGKIDNVYEILEYLDKEI